jgi:hypothetical protein
MTLSYKPSDHHELSLRSFTYQTAIDEATRRQGFLNQAREDSRPHDQAPLRAENLSYAQLAGGTTC